MMAELDRILRPEGYAILRENTGNLDLIITVIRQMQWKLLKTSQENSEVLLVLQKTMWRPALENDES